MCIRDRYGFVVKSGPGYPIPNQTDVEEVWKEESKKPKYLPLQVKTGDLAVFLQNESYEVIYKGEKYFRNSWLNRTLNYNQTSHASWLNYSKINQVL